MNVGAALDALRPAVQEASEALGIAREGRVEDILRAHLETEPAPEVTSDAEVRAPDLARLYELRARHLDWTHETGYLGFFAGNPGTRYAFRRRLEEQMILLRPQVEGTLLEVGCGAGILAVLAAGRFEQVVATDVSPTAIAFARRFGERAGARNVRFLVADAEQLPFRDGVFSATAIGEVIAHVASPERAADELARVTGPGGTLLLSTPCALSPTRAVLRLAAIFRPGVSLHRERRLDCRVAGILRGAGEPIRAEALLRLKRHFRFGEVVALMRTAGFEPRRSRGATLDLPPAALVYSRLPAWALGALRALEGALNATGLFGRALSISTVFRFEKSPGDHSERANTGGIRV